MISTVKSERWSIRMEKKNLDWSSIGFNYHQTEARFVANYKDGAWEEGALTDNANVVINECAGVKPIQQKTVKSYASALI